MGNTARVVCGKPWESTHAKATGWGKGSGEGRGGLTHPLPPAAPATGRPLSRRRHSVWAVEPLPPPQQSHHRRPTPRGSRRTHRRRRARRRGCPCRWEQRPWPPLPPVLAQKTPDFGAPHWGGRWSVRWRRARRRGRPAAAAPTATMTPPDCIRQRQQRPRRFRHGDRPCGHSVWPPRATLCARPGGYSAVRCRGGERWPRRP